MKRIMIGMCAAVCAACAFAAEVKVDFSTETGPVKPVNGVGQPPMLGFGNDCLFHYLTEAGIPFSRLHDTDGAFGKNVYVDIPNIFRDFDADENDPKNYDFAFTDDLMVKLDKAGVRPYFRLGVTIENGAARRAYRIFPPKDYAKWARICEHVMAHYVEGWANGPTGKSGTRPTSIPRRSSTRCGRGRSRSSSASISRRPRT